MHSEGTFKAKDGLDLYEQWWLPEGEMKAMVVIVHGLAEHCGRYAHVAAALNAQGYGVGCYDQHGHGKSDPAGPKAVIDTFDGLWDDLDIFMARARERANGKPLFLFGHSMGGEIVVSYVLDREPEVQGLLASAAAVKMSDDISPLLMAAASVLSKIAPKMPTIVLDGTAISRDQAVVDKYDSDPLNYRGGVPARTGGEMNRIIKFINANMEKITLPILIMHGTADRLADPQGSKDLYARVQSADKTLKLYEGFYHEILNEPEKDQVLADMVQWLDAHLS
ncbi:MAG: alpha/beta hydrolase [Anaerolineaceae bacterium]|jgi:alpha-beta hydrolase superfamily lysophospholipase|nr:alpha/beta hydrolase [Anaerolineaceae bacterium]